MEAAVDDGGETRVTGRPASSLPSWTGGTPRWTKGTTVSKADGDDLVCSSFAPPDDGAPGSTDSTAGAPSVSSNKGGDVCVQAGLASSLW
jgi:hypothetical protein